MLMHKHGKYCDLFYSKDATNTHHHTIVSFMQFMPLFCLLTI